MYFCVLCCWFLFFYELLLLKTKLIVLLGMYVCMYVYVGR